MLGPVVVVVALALLVVHMARRGGPSAIDPNASNAQQLPPNVTVPATGMQNPVSPATAGGLPLGSAANNLRLLSTFKITNLNAARVAINPPPRVSQSASVAAAIGPTQADSSLPTQNVATTVGLKIPGAGIQSNTSSNIRKL